MNAQVFEIASKLEETPLLGSPTLRDPSVPLPEPPVQEQDSFEGAKPYTDEDINEVCLSFVFFVFVHTFVVYLFFVLSVIIVSCYFISLGYALAYVVSNIICFVEVKSFLFIF